MEPCHRGSTWGAEEVLHNNLGNKAYMFATGRPWWFVSWPRHGRDCPSFFSPQKKIWRRSVSHPSPTIVFFQYCHEPGKCFTTFQKQFDTNWFNTLVLLDKSFCASPYKTRITETSCITGRDNYSLDVHHQMEHTLCSFLEIIFFRWDSSPATRIGETLCNTLPPFRRKNFSVIPLRASGLLITI